MSILSRFLLVIATLLLLIVAGLVYFQLIGQVIGDNSADEIPSITADLAVVDDRQIERGQYLALAGNCASCHTTENAGFMAGGVAFETPFGRIYSTNITPDAITGIGNWTVQQQ